MQMLVMAWLAYEITNSAFLVAVFAALRLTPRLFGPFLGAVADKVNRHKLLLATQILQIILASTLAILISTGLLEFWSLSVIGFIGGVAWGTTYTTRSAMAMDIVGQDNVTNAMALNVGAMNTTRAIGPALGGVLIPLFGPANCLWIAIVWGVMAMVALFKVRIPAKTTALGQKSILQGLNEGFKFIIHHRNMLSLLLISVMANLTVWPTYQSFMAVFAKDNLGLGADGLGFLYTAMGVGALIGAITLASLGNFKRKGLAYLYGTALYGFFFGAFALSRSLPLALVLIGLSGLGSSLFTTLMSTLMLKMAPEDMRGRAMGFLTMAIGVQPFACLALGAVANYIGASLTTAISCGMLVLVIIVISLALPNIRRLE